MRLDYEPKGERRTKVLLIVGACVSGSLAALAAVFALFAYRGESEAGVLYGGFFAVMASLFTATFLIEIVTPTQ